MSYTVRRCPKIKGIMLQAPLDYSTSPPYHGDGLVSKHSLPIPQGRKIPYPRHRTSCC